MMHIFNVSHITDMRQHEHLGRIQLTPCQINMRFDKTSNMLFLNDLNIMSNLLRIKQARIMNFGDAEQAVDVRPRFLQR